MPRCALCKETKGKHLFSKAQAKKGDAGMCMDCVAAKEAQAAQAPQTMQAAPQAAAASAATASASTPTSATSNTAAASAASASSGVVGSSAAVDSTAVGAISPNSAYSLQLDSQAPVVRSWKAERAKFACITVARSQLCQMLNRQDAFACLPSSSAGGAAPQEPSLHAIYHSGSGWHASDASILRELGVARRTSLSADLRMEGNAHFSAVPARTEQAVTAYNRAESYAPWDIAVFGNRSAAYLKLGQLSRALADAEAAIARDPAYPRGYLRQATVYEAMGEFSLARAVLERTSVMIATGPGYDELGTALEKVKRAQRDEPVGAAGEDLTKLAAFAAKFPSSMRLALKLKQAYLDARRYSDALAVKAINGAKSHQLAQALYLDGLAFKNLDAFERAQVSFLVAVEQAGPMGHPQALVELQLDALMCQVMPFIARAFRADDYATVCTLCTSLLSQLPLRDTQREVVLLLLRADARLQGAQYDAVLHDCALLEDRSPFISSKAFVVEFVGRLRTLCYVATNNLAELGAIEAGLPQRSSTPPVFSMRATYCMIAATLLEESLRRMNNLVAICSDTETPSNPFFKFGPFEMFGAMHGDDCDGDALHEALIENCLLANPDLGSTHSSHARLAMCMRAMRLLLDPTKRAAYLAGTEVEGFSKRQAA